MLSTGPVDDLAGVRDPLALPGDLAAERLELGPHHLVQLARVLSQLRVGPLEDEQHVHELVGQWDEPRGASLATDVDVDAVEALEPREVVAEANLSGVARLDRFAEEHLAGR